MKSRGALKIFFGYSAGCGKTYAMLKAARELISEGEDVVLGYFEPHDREETIKLAEGLETLPLKEISYRGITLKEFDVDAAVARKPTVLLLDELAHTNAPGSKNRKRYLDAEELLSAGINVYTTVNVQHIEGLHDLLVSATGVDVLERVPDEIFDYADEIVLIDIEPHDLIDRMKEGKIYKKNKAVSALENFFKTDNLLSLRELFMRRSADRIEKISNNGMLKTKILALISPSPSSQKNIRVAARMAEAYHCRFSAIYVETNGELSDEAALSLKKHMKLVRDMGGELVVKYSDEVVDTVVSYARAAGVTNLIMGKTWRAAKRKMGLEDKFIVSLPDVEILIVPDNNQIVMPKVRLIDKAKNFFQKNKSSACDKAANKTLDIINLISSAKEDDFKTDSLSSILSRAFSRSCYIECGKKIESASFNKEDTSFFKSEKEQAVLSWCKNNDKAAGRGTDTLREANAIYFPITKGGKTAVLAFSCEEGKMSVTDKLMFNQLTALLKIVLPF